MKYTTADLKRVATGNLAPPPCDKTLQVTVNYAEDGLAKGTWEVDRKYINGHGVVMGGFLTAAADIMMAYAITSQLADNQGFASVDIHTTFHRPAVEGEITVTAQVEKLGRTLAYVVADLFQNGKKVASSVSSLLIRTEK